MNNRMKHWAAFLLALCLMTGGPWLLKTGRGEAMSWNDADENQQAAVLNALKCALSDPDLREKAQDFAKQLGTKGLGGLLQNRLPLDLTQLSDAEEALTKDFITAIENGDIGNGGIPYITVTYEEGQWKLAVTDGRHDAASPGSAPVTPQDEDKGVTAIVTADNPALFAVPNGDVAADEAQKLQSLGLQGGSVAVLNWDMYTTNSSPATVTFAPRGTSGAQTLIVMHYHNGVWVNEPSASGPTITVTFSDF